MSGTNRIMPPPLPAAVQSTSGRSLFYEIGAFVLFVMLVGLECTSDILRGLPALQSLPRVGGVMMLLLIVLGVSRFWKRARARRPTAMIAFITLLVLTLPAANHFVGALKLHRTVQGGRVVSHGVSFAPPKGWRRLDTRSRKHIACFASPNVSTKLLPRKQVVIEAGPPRLASAEATAAGLAKDWGGRVLPETTTLDGVRAFRVRAEYRGSGLQPVEAVVASHGEDVYLIMGGVSVNESCAREIDDIRKSWKWEAP